MQLVNLSLRGNYFYIYCFFISFVFKAKCKAMCLNICHDNVHSIYLLTVYVNSAKTSEGMVLEEICHMFPNWKLIVD